MAVDLDGLAADLGAETNVLLAVLEPLDVAGWATPTPAPGWRIQEQIAHLAYFDEAAATAARDADAFQRELEAALADPDGITERISARSRGMQPDAVLDWFLGARAEMVSTFLALDPSARVPWYGPPMSLASSLTARIMETWAHGQDVFDALGAAHPVTAAVRHVAYLGYRTVGFSFGNPHAHARRTGPALDFALVVTQRRHLDATALEVAGPVATQWMGIAQAFAGPPGKGRTAGAQP